MIPAGGALWFRNTHRLCGECERVFDALQVRNRFSPADDGCCRAVRLARLQPGRPATVPIPARVPRAPPQGAHPSNPGNTHPLPPASRWVGGQTDRCYYGETPRVLGQREFAWLSAAAACYRRRKSGCSMLGQDEAHIDKAIGATFWVEEKGEENCFAFLSNSFRQPLKFA